MLPSVIKTSKSGAQACDIISAEYEKRRIYLTGTINENSAAEVVAQINYLADLSDEDITIIIQSGGGSVTAGYAILDAMAGSGCDISTVVNGIAASMAAVIAVAGTKGKRFIGKFSEMMIHQPLAGAEGQASDIERVATHLLNTKKQLNELLSEYTGQSYEVICRDTDRDYYMGAAAAVNYGLCDAVFEGF